MRTQETWQSYSYRDLPPEPVPPRVRCCGDCGEEVTSWQFGADESVDRCSGCGQIEGPIMWVPWLVYEDGPEVTVAYIEQRSIA